jgi:hypothetical protein
VDLWDADLWVVAAARGQHGHVHGGAWAAGLCRQSGARERGAGGTGRQPQPAQRCWGHGPPAQRCQGLQGRAVPGQWRRLGQLQGRRDDGSGCRGAVAAATRAQWWRRLQGRGDGGGSGAGQGAVVAAAAGQGTVVAAARVLV